MFGGNYGLLVGTPGGHFAFNSFTSFADGFHFGSPHWSFVGVFQGLSFLGGNPIVLRRVYIIIRTAVSVRRLRLHVHVALLFLAWGLFRLFLFRRNRNFRLRHLVRLGLDCLDLFTILIRLKLLNRPGLHILSLNSIDKRWLLVHLLVRARLVDCAGQLSFLRGAGD
jgi:hypothetical protein